MQSAVTKTQLSNGLVVLLKEIHSAPIITHWVEHMQFKGTSQFPAAVLDKAISRDGGYWNAFTYLDWTTYFATMPADKIDLVIRLEADRMMNSAFNPDDVASERTVIISEREGNENEPLFKLGEEIQAAAFRVHSYHHEVIGDLSDLQTMQQEDLYRHYRNFYTPSNAVLAVAGDFDTQKLLGRIRELFEPVPAGSVPPGTNRPEPLQPGERRVTVEGPGETVYLQIAYRAPAAANQDFFPLSVLDSLLTGPSNLNFFGSGISNKTSRLYRALVEGELAISVYGGLQATIDPYLYTITIIVRPGRSVEEVLSTVESEIQRLQEAPPPVEEVSRAVKQARALFAYGTESITNQGFWMGFSEMFADYDWFLHYLDALETVTPGDVQQAAQRYLRLQNRTLGVYMPTLDEEVLS